MASENNNWLDDTLAKAIGGEKPEPDFGKWQQEHPQAVQMLKSQATRQPHPRRLLDIKRIIMKSPITKLAAAAVIIVAVVVSISVFNKSMPTAFGIEQVINASDSIRFLYVKSFEPNQHVFSEFWIKADEQGHITGIRCDLKETDDGPKLVSWTPERTEVWFKSKREFLICQSEEAFRGWQFLLDSCQPKLLMEKLLKDQKEGKVDIDIQKPPDKQKPILIVATYKKEQVKKIYYIDQATDLITHVEAYSIKGDKESLGSTRQFSGYNVPIDENMFSIKNEVPMEVPIFDRLSQNCGVLQGGMTDEQATTETVRQFFQALIDKDYKKAGLIYGGELEGYAKEEFGGINVTAIVSIGVPIPKPDCDKRCFQVPCELEISNSDGQKTTWKTNPYVMPINDNRWGIVDGINVGEITPKAIKPKPADGAMCGQIADLKLSWMPGMYSSEHKVYIGTATDKLSLLADVSGDSNVIVQELHQDTTYYWRVDEIDANGAITAGNIWSFITTGKLLGWWKLDESTGTIAYDNSGNGNNGTLMGNPVWRPQGGKFGGALEFSGKGDYVEISNEANFDINDQITISAWVNITDVPQEWTGIVTKGDSAWRLSTSFAKNVFHFGIARDDYLNGQATVDSGQWHNVVCVYDGQEIRIYVDGKLDASMPRTGPIGTNDYPVCIGENIELTGHCFHGLIDDVRIYNYALSENEVVKLYNSSD